MNISYHLVDVPEDKLYHRPFDAFGAAYILTEDGTLFYTPLGGGHSDIYNYMFDVAGLEMTMDNYNQFFDIVTSWGRIHLDAGKIYKYGGQLEDEQLEEFTGLSTEGWVPGNAVKYDKLADVYYGDDEESPYEDDEWEEGEWLEDQLPLFEPRFQVGDRIRYQDQFGIVMETPSQAQLGEGYWYMVHLDDGTEYIIKEEFLDWEEEFSFTEEDTSFLPWEEPGGELWPDFIPWGEVEQDYYRTAAFGDSPWVMRDDKIYIGFPHEHHPELMHRVMPDLFDTSIKWNDTERYEEPIYGIIRPNGEVRVYAWGNSELGVNPELVEQIQQRVEEQWLREGETLRTSSNEWVADPWTKWKTLRNPAGGQSIYPNYNPKHLWKFQDYLLTMEDRMRETTFNGLVFKDTWEPPKLWMGDQEMDYIFKDKETNEYLRFTQEEVNEMQRNDWLVHLPRENSFIKEYTQIEDRSPRRELVSPTWEWDVDPVPDTIPWGEAEQDFYRTSATDWDYIGIFWYNKNFGLLLDTDNSYTHADLLYYKGKEEDLHGPALDDPQNSFPGWIFQSGERIVAVPASMEYSGNKALKNQAIKALKEHFPTIEFSFAEEGMYQWNEAPIEDERDGLSATDLAWHVGNYDGWEVSEVETELDPREQPWKDNRRPVLFSRMHQQIFVGSHGTHHDDLARALGLEDNEDGEPNWYDNMGWDIILNDHVFYKNDGEVTDILEGWLLDQTYGPLKTSKVQWVRSDGDFHGMGNPFFYDGRTDTLYISSDEVFHIDLAMTLDGMGATDFNRRFLKGDSDLVYGRTEEDYTEIYDSHGVPPEVQQRVQDLLEEAEIHRPIKFSGWQRVGISGIPANYTDDDPLDLQGKAPYIEAMNTEWWNLTPEQQKQTIINAFRATMLSPRMNLKSNAILYQLIADIPADESNPDVFEQRVREIKKKWDAQGQMGLEQAPEDVYALDEILPGKFMPGFWGNLRRLANLGPYADEIWAAADADMKNGGTGELFRQMILELQLPGVGPKVASFAWLALAPMTSELATVDVHMMKHLERDYDSPKNDNEYFELEQILKQERDQMYGDTTPLAWYQWGVWDKRRTPGFHQDHTPLRAHEPTDFRQVDWPPPMRPPRPKKPPETMFDQMSLAKVSMVIDQIGDWQIISYLDKEFQYGTGMDWRYPMFIDQDEKKIFVGPNNAYHSQLIEWMGGDDPNHGSIWVSDRNRELGAKDWLAGYIRNNGAIEIWDAYDVDTNEMRDVIESWWPSHSNPPRTSAAAYNIMYVPVVEEDINERWLQHAAPTGVSPNYFKFFRAPDDRVFVWNIVPNKNEEWDYDGYPSHSDIVEKTIGISWNDIPEDGEMDFGWISPDYEDSMNGDYELVEAVKEFIRQNNGGVL